MSSEGESSLRSNEGAAVFDFLNNDARLMSGFFPGSLDQTDVDGEDGEGECRTGSGGSQHHRLAGKHTHPQSV